MPQYWAILTGNSQPIDHPEGLIYLSKETGMVALMPRVGKWRRANQSIDSWMSGLGDNMTVKITPEQARQALANICPSASLPGLESQHGSEDQPLDALRAP